METIARAAAPKPRRIAAMVDRVGSPDANGCRCWDGAHDGGGYPHVRRDGRLTRVSRVLLAARLGRPIAPGAFALHKCPGGGNRWCVAAEHIEEGTHAENMVDMAVSGRSTAGDRNPARLYPERVQRGDSHWTRRHPEKIARGDRSGARLHPELYGTPTNARLSLADAAEVRRRVSSGELQRVVALAFGVTQSHVSRIVRGKQWRRVP